MRLSPRILIASSNRGKFEEFSALFKKYPEIKPVPIWEIVRNPKSLGYVEHHDEKATYRSNAIAKARLANSGAHYPVLADDSGLEVLALEGKPGIRSHKYATPKPRMSQEEANIQQVLKEVAGKPRTARMVCALALLIEGILIEAQGSIEGTLAETPRGANGFGYDSIFIPSPSDTNNDMGLTFAEMADVEKNAISHRARALDALMNSVRSHGIVFAKP